MSGRPPESSYDSAEIRRNAASAADSRQFWFKPWVESSGLSPDELAVHVRSELASKGTWADYCELRMGGGPTAQIDLVEINGETWFRATGGFGLIVTADYRTLEHALDMVQLFARISWDIYEATKAYPFRIP
jgi:hypothetical protein